MARKMSIDTNSKVTLETALRTHQEWKVRLNEAVKAGEKLDDVTIARDDCCDLGIWLHSEGGRKYGHLPEFTKLLAAHSEFHKVTSIVARLINGQDKESFNSMLNRGSQFTSATTDVTVAIVRLKAAVSIVTE